MARALLALWLACTGLLTGCLSRGQVTAASSSDIAWSSFEWVGATIGGERFDKVAILVPLSADTLRGTYWLQLDTGADAGIWLYTAPLDQLLRRTGVARDTSHWFEIPRGSVGGYVIHDEAVNIRRYSGDTIRAGDVHPQIGTLGLNFFRNRVLLLDFPHGRFAILDSATSLPQEIEQHAAWVPAEYRSQKLFLPLTIAGTTNGDYFYDSGASLFPLSTTKELWQAATGRSGAEPDNRTIRVPSFGQQATFVGAPAQGDIAVGSATLERPMIYFMASGPERLDFRTWGFPVSGLIGNVLFADELVVVDLPHRRFGVLAAGK